MSEPYGRDDGREAIATDRKSWERPAAADDIVDPIEIGTPSSAETAGLDPYAATPTEIDREVSDEESEDVPLGVQVTDALSMLAQGGHDYGATPLEAGDPLEDDDDLEAVEIDESSKDA